jgi:hypothetical protein
LQRDPYHFDALLVLDMPAWATLTGLIAECPVIHAALGASQDPAAQHVDASDFSFIGENGQITAVQAFLNDLPHILGS